MDFTIGFDGLEHEIVELFTAVFTESEGADEGALIGSFVRELLEVTPQEDLIICSARDAGELIGCVAFSRLFFAQDTRSAFILSPAAVRTDHQRAGVGQKLIRFGLSSLKQAGVDVAITYGDPAYYAKTGFEQITEDIAQAPLKLNFPHGWLGQSLNANEFTPLKGPSHCVAALNRPDLW